MTMHEKNADGSPTRPDYRHVVPLLLVVAFAVGGALFARARLVPPTFGTYGHYRAGALDDEKAIETRHAGLNACAECHDDIVAIHAKDAHASVQCQTCHGPGRKHVEDNDAPMPRPDTKEDCLVCHRQLEARPGSFPQVDWKKHYEFVGVADTNVACIRCHSGHEPLFMDRDLRQARLHPLVHDCGDCHIGRTDETLKRPPTHPQIFQCDYCHPSIASSFAKAKHQKIRCTTCHLFIKENAFSGRIVRDADPRFCLLCHRKADFKSASGPPTIDWPAHIEDVSSDPPDPKRSCVECHQDAIHDLYPGEVPHAL
jgi:hypothetical protein